jgi:AraC-like DNA-binding protein
LRQMLRTKLPRGRCSADDMARNLGLHKRTLNRHLKAAGTGFRAVADGVRFEVARQLVADTNIPLAQISAALDFSEPAAFTRAFERWSGVSPSLLRSQQKAA